MLVVRTTVVGPFAENTYLAGCSETGEAILVDPEVVGELVEDGDPDLPLKGRRIVPELLQQRAPVDRHPRGEVRRLLEEPEEIRLLRVLLLDHHRDVFQAGGEVGRQRVQGVPNVLLEVRH